MLNDKNWKKYIILLVIISLSIYALILRLDKLARTEPWGDELNQLKVMKGGFLHLVKELPRNERHQYLNLDHFLIYPFFKVFSFNKWGLAIPHILVTLLGFYLLYLIGKRYFKTIWGYIISFGVVCFNATLINHATEIRGYAVLPTLAMATLYLSEMLVNEVDLSRIKRFFIGFFFLFTILFHAYGIFILFFCLVYVLWNKPIGQTFSSVFKRISKIIIVVFSIGVPFWLFCVFGPQHVKYVAENKYQFIPNPLNNIIGFLKGLFGNLVGFRKFYFLLVALAFPFIFPYKERMKQLSFLFIMIFSPLILIYITDMIGEYWFIQRQFIWVMPYFAIFLGWSCDSLINYLTELKRLPAKEKR